TSEILEKNIPGIPELIRMKTFENTRFSVLSRAVAGIRGNALIINLPGGLKGIKESFKILTEIISHAVKMIRGFPHEN
ncbi:MAG: MogA/MoaB family molybdenum cofactor biosynthesis protein, partial [Candidatus Omnitrophica bacterium]|nr:MogA/MoaB family molybdenum cofactor biosynthesis protein [Candidatus Omnitrophota bacterium]